MVGQSLKVLRVNAGETDKEWATISSGLTIGTTTIASGTTKRVLFQDGSVVSQSANFVFDASNQLVIGGHTGGARLDVKCVGALSTDKGFIIMPSTGGTPHLKTNGIGQVNINKQLSLGDYESIDKKLYIVRTAETYGIDIDWYGGSTTGMRIVNSGSGDNTSLLLSSYNGTSNYALSISNGDISMSGTSGTKIGVSNTQKIGFWNATPIVQPTTAVGTSTLTSGGGTNITDTDTFDGYTLKQIVKALRNTGLLA